MNQPSPQIYCSNPNCVAPLNAIGKTTCQSCDATLVYRYLWAVGKGAPQISTGQQVGNRYYVVANCIWLDTQPSLPPEVPEHWADEITPYLKLYPQRLHVPEVYSCCIDPEVSPDGSIFLLENIPLDADGILYPTLVSAWEGAHPVRQLYWLWQLLNLWQPLQKQGVAISLFAIDNLRAQGWRIRLCQLYQDQEILAETAPDLTLVDLGHLWSRLTETAKPPIRAALEQLCEQLQAESTTVEAIAAQLNQLLLQQAAQLPLRLNLVGLTDTGKERSHNEDSCYPLSSTDKPNDGLFPRVAIVCDGIGGHEGGEVASQLAVQSLKLQTQALLAEVAQQTELISPDLLIEQLEASVRVVNNLIVTQNDSQGRADRRRMGTTLVMAVQVPQQIATADGMFDNCHELYLVSVGDSRAYWITPRHCQQLTIDDDVAAREVRMGRSLYREALYRPDAGALTQALGTRDASYLRPAVQRFLLEEDGILLLCSDGLSDNNLVEQFWQGLSDPVFLGKRTLTEAAQTWVDLANQKNGHDNISVVLLQARISTPVPEVALPNPQSAAATDWSAASRALTDAPIEIDLPSTAVQKTRQPGKGLLVIGLVTFLLLAIGVGFAVWRELNPESFRQWQERVLPSQPSP